MRSIPSLKPFSLLESMKESATETFVPWSWSDTSLTVDDENTSASNDNSDTPLFQERTTTEEGKIVFGDIVGEVIGSNLSPTSHHNYRR